MYDGQESAAVDNVTISISQGEYVAVLGRNGSGKSTLAKHFNVILLPDSGTVVVDNMTTSDDGLIFDIRRTVGMVFQNPDNQIVATVVEDDVAFAPENLGIPPSEIRERVDGALKSVGMYEFRKHAPHQLSGGQKQRVAIAGVLAMQSKCIVFDEASSMLDPKGRRELTATIKKLNQDGATVINITHFMDEAIEADRVIVMDKGRVLLDGTPRDIFADRKLLEDAGLDLPQAAALADCLRQDGLDIKSGVLTADELVEEIICLL